MLHFPHKHRKASQHVIKIKPLVLIDQKIPMAMGGRAMISFGNCGLLGTRNVYPLQLELYLSTLNVLQPENHVLGKPTVPPANMALICEAIPGAWSDRLYDGAVPNVLRVHIYSFHQGCYIDLCVSHRVISAESVLVKHLLLALKEEKKRINVSTHKRNDNILGHEKQSAHKLKWFTGIRDRQS